MDHATTGAKYNCPAMQELRRLHSNLPGTRPFVEAAMSYLRLFRDAHPDDYYAPEVDLDVDGYGPESVDLEWGTPSVTILASFRADGSTVFGRYRKSGRRFEQHHAGSPEEALSMTHWPDVACHG